MTPPHKSAALADKTFLVLLASVTLAFAWILWPYFGAVFWAAILAVVFAPTYRYISAHLGDRASAGALATLVMILLIVILPAVLIGAMLLDEAMTTYQRIESGELDPAGYVRTIFDALPTWTTDLLGRFGVSSLADVQEKLSSGIARAARFFAYGALNVGQNALEFVVSFFVMLYVLFFLLRDGASLRVRAREAVPLRRELQRDLATRFVNVIRATIKGNVVIAIVQGTLGGIAFWALGVTGALMWGVLMAFLSLLPAVGTALVWIPVAIYLMLAGAFWKAIGLVAFGTLVIGLVDNVLRPTLVGKDTKMPDYVVLLSTLGGIAVFGFNGFVIGPIIAAMFIAVWDTQATYARERE
jgi:predicted PurR-regulated permease PerM